MIVRVADRGALDRACVRWLAARLAPAGGGRVVLAVCGGRSVDGILAGLADCTGIHWPSVHLFLADERLVGPAHPDSNLRQVRAALADPLVGRGLLPAANLHPFPLPEAPDVDDARRAAAACTHALDALGGRLDLVLLSAGEDGHVASLFPGHRSIDDPAAGFIVVEDAPKPPPVRISASCSLLQGARHAALVFTGEAKRAALAAFEAEGAGRAIAGDLAQPAPGAGPSRGAGGHVAPGLDIRRQPARLVRSLPEWTAFTDLDVR